jgi:hypothetical protein
MAVVVQFSLGEARAAVTSLERAVARLATLTGLTDSGTWEGYVGSKFVHVRICEAAVQRRFDAVSKRGGHHGAAR